MHFRKWLPGVAALFLVVLNVWIAWRLFFIKWLDHFNSIEGAFIALGRYVSQHPFGAGWLPFWHGGMPFEIVYVPGLHFVTGWTAWLAGMPASHAYHLVTAFFYVLGPLTFFFLMRQLGARTGESLLAAVVYSIFSVSTVLMPVVWADMNGSLASRRLHVLVNYGEGPHVTALTFVPLVILGLQRVLEKYSFRRLAFTALAIAAVVVTNVPATMGLALIVFCWIAVQPEQLRALRLAALSGGLGYLLAMGAVPPSKYLRVLDTVGAMHPGFGATSPLRFLLLALCLGMAFVLGRFLVRRQATLPMRLFVTVFCLLALIVLSATPNKFELLPQAQRLHIEMDLAFAAVLSWLVFRMLRSSSPRVRRAIAVIVVLMVCRQAFKARQKARTELRAADISVQSEYQSAKWLADHLPSTRVFAPGSTGFWLNAFTDVPQLGGCCDESWGGAGAVVHPLIYRVNLARSEEEARSAVAWLRVYGVGALVGTGSSSTEYYGDFRNPERYAFLPVLYSGTGDVIYQVPDAGGLFYVVARQDLVMERVPDDLVITPEVARYIKATSAEHQASSRQIGPDTIRIDAVLRDSDVIATKMAYSDGWSIGNGRIFPDKLGLMVMEPQCRGNCSVTLQWIGPLSTRVARWVSLAAMIGLAGMLALPLITLFGKKASRSDSAAMTDQSCSSR